MQETNKIYSLGNTKTNKGLKLRYMFSMCPVQCFIYYFRHALQERLFRIEYVSNSNFTSTEFDRWKKEVRLTFSRHMVCLLN